MLTLFFFLILIIFFKSPTDDVPPMHGSYLNDLPVLSLVHVLSEDELELVAHHVGHADGGVVLRQGTVHRYLYVLLRADGVLVLQVLEGGGPYTVVETVGLPQRILGT